jgi:hypothetical protein
MILNFLNRLPQWGGRVCHETKKNFEKYSFRNTCSIDYLLFSLWISSQLSDKLSLLDNFTNYEFSDQIKKIIEAIHNNEWNKAKTRFLTFVKSKLQDVVLIVSIQNSKCLLNMFKRFKNFAYIARIKSVT